jgi:hypothetical protein
VVEAGESQGSWLERGAEGERKHEESKSLAGLKLDPHVQERHEKQTRSSVMSVERGEQR